MPGLRLVKPDQAVAIDCHAANKGVVAGRRRDTGGRADATGDGEDIIGMGCGIVLPDSVGTLLAEPEITGAVAINQMRDIVDSDFVRSDGAIGGDGEIADIS